MSWQATVRPGWVEAINAGSIPLLGADEPLAADLELPDDAGAAEAFSTALNAFESEARLTRLGRWATRRYLRRLLHQRRALDPLPGGPAPVEPVFVIGPPRSGTTVMQRLLTASRGLRTPTGVEFLYPVAVADCHVRAAAELTFPQTVNRGLRAIHTYSVDMPKECLSAMAFSGRTEEFVSRYDVPTYARWLARADMAPAYEMHRKVLATLDPCGTTRWVLKSPVHLQSIPEVVAAYPDARFVITHREPDDVLASVSSLICTLRSAFSDHVDPAAVGRHHLELYGRSLDALVDHVSTGLLPRDRTVHVAHADIVADAPAVIGAVCVELGLPHDAAAVGVAHAAERHDGVGAHRYEAADFGLPEATPVFDRYRSMFLSGDAEAVRGR